MLEIKNLFVEQEKTQSMLNDNRGDWAFHIKEDHQGIPATTCHMCINYKQNLILLEEDLRYIQQKLLI